VVIKGPIPRVSHVNNECHLTGYHFV